MIVIPASLRSDFIHMAGMTIHIALESTIHIAGIRIVHIPVKVPHQLKMCRARHSPTESLKWIPTRHVGRCGQFSPDDSEGVLRFVRRRCCREGNGTCRLVFAFQGVNVAFRGLQM